MIIAIVIADLDLEPTDGRYNLEALVRDYAARVQTRIWNRYPDAEIRMRILSNTRGGGSVRIEEDAHADRVEEIVRLYLDREFEATDWERFIVR